MTMSSRLWRSNSSSEGSRFSAAPRAAGQIVQPERRFLALMAAGSLVGAFIGGQLLGLVLTTLLLPMLAAIVFISSVRVWKHA